MAEMTADARLVVRNTWLSNLTAGLVLGFTEVVFSVSIASLIFSGPLEAYLPRGLTIVLVTSTVSILFTALFASIEGVISGIQDNPSVLIAVAAASLAASVGAGPELLPTVITFIALTSLLTGAFLLILGTFRLGGLMRYIPYPVIGGFLAGMGWLLIQGAISATAGHTLSLETLPTLVQAQVLIRWLPGIVFGLILFVGVRRINHYLALPGILLGGLTWFLVLVMVSGLTVEQAGANGLVLGPMGGLATWQPLPWQAAMEADWGAVLGQAGNTGTILALTALILLMHVSGLELALHRDIDLNRELRAAGAANVVSGLLGGMIGYQDLSYTVLNYRVGARGRLSGLIAGLICLLMLVAGAALFSYIPKPLVGGMLFFLGLNFLDEWVIQGRKRLGRADYGVVLLMLITIAATNFLVGVGVGLLLMVGIFVLNYSRTNIFHHVLSGADLTSNVERDAYQQRELAKLGRHVYILQLEGFIFFGTANAIVEQVRQRLHAQDEGALLCLILDFRRVTGLDSSAVFSLTKVKHLADAHDFVLVFTQLRDETEQELVRHGLKTDERTLFLPDLDHGLEWCEEHVLSRKLTTLELIPMRLEQQLTLLGFASDDVTRLRPYLEKIRLQAGEYLIHQGEPFHDLYFIESGQVSVYLEMDNGKRIRIQKPGPGTIVGELGFYLDTPRSASVVAEMSTTAYRLTRRAMAEMKVKEPQLAIAFNDLMLHVVAERLVTTNQTVMALNR